MNYRVRGGETTVDFKGTALLPDSKGNASIESRKKGYVEIDAAFEDLKAASIFAPGISDDTYCGRLHRRGAQQTSVKSFLDGDDGKLPRYNRTSSLWIDRYG